ncbi:MAG: hypothetical protein CSB24_00020 [Deltaproteobacteria bacterium]|nr:MAG: hypothetical protein CSB24_00020 [Deltaproteobacteria bacterium]
MSDNKQPQDFVEEIKNCLGNKDFAQADQLREELMNVHPAALSEIIKTAEIIEEAKTEGLDKQHLELWAELYDDLSDEEVNALFYSLKEITIGPQKKILSHGMYNSKLFFIEDGKVAVFINKDNKNKVIAQLGKGNLLGEHTLTTISLCPASAASTSEVRLRYVDDSVSDKWQEDFPVLHSKLVRFCEKKGKIEKIMCQKELKKRSHERIKASGKVVAVVLDKDGKRTSSAINGDLADISVDGCCFAIHCAKKAIAKSLLARHCQMSISAGDEANPVKIAAVGKIVKVSFYLHGDYSVHMSFVKPLDQAALQPLMPPS